MEGIELNYLETNDTKYYLQDDGTIIVVVSGTNVEDTFISSDENINNNGEFLKIGVDNNSQNSYLTRTLIKFNLPSLPLNAYIMSSRVELTGALESSIIESSNEYVIDVHECLSSWSETSSSWESLYSSYNSIIEDNFQAIRSQSIESLNNVSFNITNLTRKWYNGESNNGIMLKAHTEEILENGRVALFNSSDTNSILNTGPKLYIRYCSISSIDDNLLLKEKQFSNGKSSINYLDGKVNFEFSLCNLKKEYELKINYNSYLNIANIPSYLFGWNYNYYQTLTFIDNSEQVLIYLNSSSIEEYLIKYYDEDLCEYYYKNSIGNIKCKLNDNQFVLENVDEQAKYWFNEIDNRWILTKFQDSDGYVLNFTYSNNKLVTISDSDSIIVNIVYDDDSIRIVLNDKTIIINFTNNKLNRISYNTNEFIDFIYLDNKISKITDINGLSTIYEYNSINSKVSLIKDMTLDEIGSFLQIKYGINVTTTIDSRDEIRTYVFDNDGVCNYVTNNDLNEELSNEYGCVYEKNLLIQNTDNNCCEVELKKYSNNYIENSNLESNGMIFGRNIELLSTDDSHSGIYSIKLSGEDTTLRDSFHLPVNHPYVFSFYAKSPNSSINVYMEYYSAVDELISRQRTYDGSAEWTRYDLDIGLYSDQPNEYRYIFIYITIDDDTTAYFDDFQLECGSTVNPYNYIGNSNFKNDLNGWVYEEKDQNDNLVSLNSYELINGTNGGKILKINSDLLFSAKLSKTISLNMKKGVNYNISFWYKNLGIISSLNETYSNKFLIELYTSENEVDYLDFSLNNNETEWQFFSYDLIPEKDYSEIKIIIQSNHCSNSIYLTNFSLIKFYENNIITEEDLSSNIVNEKLIKTFKTMEYDLNNRPISEKTILSRNIENKYYILESSTKKYLIGNFISNKINLLDNCKSYSWSFIKTDNNYSIKSDLVNDMYLNYIDGNIILGNNPAPIFTIIFNLDDSISIKLNSEDLYLFVENNEIVLSSENRSSFYLENSSNKKFIETTTKYLENSQIDYDEVGNGTNYLFNSITRMKESLINPKKIGINYIYDYKNRMIEKNILNKRINYVYNANNNIESIISDNQQYVIVYNPFNRIKKNVINNCDITRYNYYSNDGGLKDRIFNNNGILSYTYDNFGRLSSITKDEYYVYEYTYDFQNRINSIKKHSIDYDLYPGNEHDHRDYKYDNNGNIISIIDYHSVFGMDEKMFECKKIFEQNLISKLFNKVYKYISGNVVLLDERIIEYSYDNKKLTNILCENNNLNYYYDDFNRLIRININNNFDIIFDYVSNGNKTTNKISTIRYNNNVIQYVYDKVGNIKKKIVNGDLKICYYYDKLNQLIGEKNYENNYGIYYIYDSNNNILNEKKYNLSDFSTISNNTFKYSDINISNQMIKYNDKEIMYDNIGNIVSIGNINFSWTNGYELCSVESNNEEILLSYNEEGVRTSKGDKVYHVEDTKIIYEINGNNVIYYLYDNNDEYVGFIYNNNSYYFTKNQFNDILNIVNENGNIVASYEYDSWGNAVVSNYTIEKIGDINPIRYRSYYYDDEFDLYYLNKRYYSPKLHRFISIDSEIDYNDEIVSDNLYLYCNNNPIIYADPSGNVTFKYSGGKNYCLYNRKLALEYAIKYAYHPNRSQYRTYGSDCANFVSQCLHAGLIPMTGKGRKNGWHHYKTYKTIFKGILWKINYDVSESWSLVLKQMNWLINSNYSWNWLWIRNAEFIKAVIKRGLKAGDVAYLMTDMHAKGDVTHAIFISRVEKNKISYAGHTRSRDYENLLNYFTTPNKNLKNQRLVKFVLMRD